MKKILFVNILPISPSFGGVERVTYLLTLELRRRGYDILYLALQSSNAVNDNIDIAAPQHYFPNTDIHSKENVIFYNDFIIQNQINVIINQDGNLEESFLFLDINTINRKHVKIITVCHNKPLMDYGYFHKYTIHPLPDKKFSISTIITIVLKTGLFPIWWWYRQKRKRERQYRIYRWGLTHSDKFVVLSQNYMVEIGKVVGVHFYKDKFIVIPNPNTYSNNGDAYSEKQKQVLYVGRFDPVQKRPDMLLKVWRKIYKQCPEWELIFVGSGSLEMENTLQLYVYRYHLQRVSFKGNTDPLPYYRSASILALPSIYEGFPMVVTEAMVNGVVPILFDSFGATREMVIQNKTGVLVKPFNLREFAEKMLKLMGEEKTRNNMAKNAMQHVRQFNIQNIIAKWISLIETT
jgi:glycosyltransferase involved in cell wall biosynthesis